jgi:hypothetical protein
MELEDEDHWDDGDDAPRTRVRNADRVRTWLWMHA